MARVARRLRSDSGVTLVEMMVVMLLLGIILAFTTQTVASFQRAATGGERRIENLNEGRTLMQVITKDIRTAAKLSASTAPFPDTAPTDGVTQANDNELVFYANLNLTSACPKMIRLYLQYVDSVDGYKLIEAVTEPSGGAPPDTCTWPATPTLTRLVGRFIANDQVTEPIFTYYYTDATGELTAFCSHVDVANGCPADQTPLSTIDALQVKAVGVLLSVRKGTSLSVAPTTIENRVRLPNVYYNPAPSPS